MTRCFGSSLGDKLNTRPKFNFSARFVLRFFKSSLRYLLLAGLVFYFLAAVTMLAVRYLVLPHVNEWRPQIEQQVSASLGVALTIGEIAASWSGISPTLSVDRVEVKDNQGQILLSIPKANAVVSWRSLFLLQPRFAFLELTGVNLRATRHENGELTIAGKRLDGNSSVEHDSLIDIPAVNWLLKQNKIVLHDASFEWQDSLRRAPDLVMRNIDVAVENGLLSHRLLVSVDPPGDLGERLEVVIRSDDIINNLGAGTHANRQAEVYLLVQDFEPSAWAPWVDLPYDFAGRYSLRLWSDVVRGKLTHTTLDFAGNLAGRPAPAGGGLGGNVARFSMRMSGWAGDILPADFGWGLFQHSPEYSGVNVNLSAAGVSLETDWFDPSSVELDTLSAEFLLKRSPNGLYAVSLTNMNLANPELRASVQGSWRQENDLASGVAQLQGSLNQVDATRLYKYLPVSIERDTRQWFHDSITQGLFPQVSFLVNGNLDDFPFNAPGATGRFQLNGPFKNLTIDYAPGTKDEEGWPPLIDMNGTLSIDRMALNIRADNGMVTDLKGVRIPFQNLIARIPDMDRDPILTLTAGLRGDAGQVLALARSTALDEYVGDYIEGVVATGVVEIPLAITLDLTEPENAQFQAGLNFTGSTFNLPGNIPDIEQLRGIIDISNNRVAFQDVRAKFMGGDVRVSGDLGKDAKGLQADGTIGIAALRKEIPSKAMGVLNGNTRYRIQVMPRASGGFELSLNSSLQGIQIDLPAPFGKTAPESMPLSVRWTQVPSQRATQESLVLRLGDQFNARMERNQDPKNGPYFQRGVIGIGLTPPMPASGLTVDVRLPSLDWEYWSAFMDDLMDGHSGSKTNTSTKINNNAKGGTNNSNNAKGSANTNINTNSAKASTNINTNSANASTNINTNNAKNNTRTKQGNLLPQLARAHLKTDQFVWSDMKFTDLDVSATQPQPGNWSVQMESKETAGTITWKEASGAIAGRVVARLTKLAVGAPDEPEKPAQAHSVTEGQWSDIPAIDMTVDDFTLYGNRLGTVRILGTNLERGKRWSLESLEVKNPHANLNAQGELRLSGTNRGLAMKAKLDIEDLGKLTDFMGMPDRVKEGKGTLTAEVDWLNFPWIYSYAGLSGKANVELDRGVFVHVNSKSARLLELLSIQSIQRLFKLDFRPSNEFEGGFPFSNITGDLNITQGIANTENLTIRSPIAEIMMTGSSNMVSKTWDMRANVKPIFDMSGAAIATGFAVNPLVGLSALVTQFLLKTPLERAMTARYKVTGSWDDPKLEPLSDADVTADSKKEQTSKALESASKP